MDIQQVHDRALEYFTHWERPKSLADGMLLGAKILSFVILLIPCIAGATLGATELILWLRGKKITPLKPDDSKNIHKTSLDVLKPEQGSLSIALTDSEKKAAKEALASPEKLDAVINNPRQYGIRKAVHILKYYLYHAKPEEKSDALSAKLLTLYDKLVSQSREIGKMKRSWLERLVKKPPIEIPDAPPIVADVDGLHARIPQTNLGHITDRLLFQIQADEFGKGSELEGANTHQVLGFVLNYMSERAKNSPRIMLECKSMLDELQGAYTIVDKASLARALEEAKKNQKPLLIPGGWVGAPSGHAIYYEIIPTGQNKANMRIFNTGEGIQLHPKYQEGVKEKVGYAEWKNISFDRLLDPHFSQIVMEMKSEAKLPKTATPTNYSFQDIYYGLRDFLGVKESQNDDQVLESTLMQPQRAGTCSLRSLMAVIKSKMSRNEYRRFVCDMRIAALSTYIKTEAQPSKKTWRLVQKSVQKLSRKVDHLFHDKVVSNPYLHDAHLALGDAAKWLERQKPLHFDEDDLQLDFSLTKGNQTFTAMPHAALFQPEQVFQEHILSTEKLSPIKERLGKERAFSTKTVLRELSEALANKEYAAMQHAIIGYVDQISLSAYSNKMSEESAKEYIADWSKIAEFFFESCFFTSTAHVLFAEKLACMHKIHKIHELLAKKVNPEFTLPNESEFNRLAVQAHDPSTRAVLSTATYQDKSFFCDYFANIGGEIAFRNFQEKKEPSALEKAMYSYPREMSLVIKDNPNYNHCDYSQKQLILATSPHLPKWIKDLRDTQIRYHYLFKMPVCSLISSTSKPALTFVKSPFSDTLQVRIGDFAAQHRNKNSEFEAAQQSFHDPKLQAISNMLDEVHKNGEKALLAAVKSNTVPGFSKEEARELLHIFSSERFIEVEGIEYFTKHPEKLADSDYQKLFQMALFNTFHTPSDSKVEFRDALARFIQRTFEFFREQNDLKTVVFILRINRMLSRYSEYKNPLANEGEILSAILESPQASVEEKSIAYAEYGAYLSEKSKLSPQDIEKLLISIAWTANNPIPKQLKDPKTFWEIEKGIYSHSQDIVKAIKNNPDILNRVFSKATGKEVPKNWKLVSDEGRVPIYRSERNELFEPLSGRIVAINQEVYLPYHVRESPSFSRVFPNQQRAIQLEGGKYQFQDARGDAVVLSIQDNTLIVQKKIGSSWYELIDRAKLVEQRGFVEASKFESRFLIDSTSAWQSLDNPSDILLFDKNLQPAYTATIQENKTVSIRRGDGCLLSKAGKTFSRIEEDGYIHEWYTPQGNLVEVELPRFSLSFSAQGKRLESREMPGWYLAKNQTAAFLGGSSHHLVLVNERGKKRIILADQELTSSNKKEVLEPLYRRETAIQAGSTATFGYFSYDLDAEGKPIASSRDGYLHIIELLAANHEYALAAALLRKHGDKLSGYTQSETARLERIVNIQKVTGDTSGEQNSIALYAAFLLATNPGCESKVKDSLGTLYERYLVRFKNTHALRLTPEEETRLSKNLLAKGHVEAFYKRLRELDPSYAANYTPVSQKPVITPSAKLTVANFLRDIRVYRTDDVLYSALLTRSADDIREHFYTYITDALTGTASQKKWLQTAATFLCHDKDDKNRALGYLFKELLKNPSKFTPPPGNDDRGYNPDLERWRNSFATICLTILLPDAADSSVKRSKDITKPYYRLEKKLPPQAKIACTFDIPSVVPLSDLIHVRPIPFTSPKEYTVDLHEWFETQKEASIDEPLTHKEYGRLQGDLAAYSATSTRMTYALTEPLQSVKDTLADKVKRDERRMAELAEAMIRAANVLPHDETKQKLAALQKMGGSKKDISLDDIFISFAQENTSLLLAKNESISKEELKMIYTYAVEYLQVSVDKQQAEKALSLSDGGQIAELIEAKRAYNIEEHTAYLVFEHYAGIYMREAQKSKIDAFIKNGDLNPVMEMIMGSGKSKVLLPLLGLLRADGKKLSMLVVPQPLFESVSSDTQKILQEGFSKSLRTLHFDRNTTFTKRSLEEIRDTLQDIIKNKECLIMTSKSVQSLLLKFVEHANTAFRREQFLQDETMLMVDILTMIKTAAVPLIDEVDTVLNVLHEVSFSLGSIVPPKTQDIAVVSTLYNLLFQDPDLKRVAKLECDPRPDPQAPPLTKELYFERLQKPLAMAFLEKMKMAPFQDQKVNQELSNYLKDSNNYTMILNYLLRDKATQKEAYNHYSKLPVSLQNIFALASEELSHLLPYTLVQITDEKFGLDKDVIAIPYSAANTPSHGSLFANPYITMNYTFQTHMKKGVTKDTLKAQVAKLKKRADIEVAESGGTKLLSETESYKLFEKIKGNLAIPLIAVLNDDQLDKLFKKVNESEESIAKIIQEAFLVQLELYEAKISCNPLMLASLFSTLAGFTGTLWNADSLHRKVLAMPEAGTDARTISLLWKMSSEKDNVIRLAKGSVSSMLKQLSNHSIDLIADAGGYFKEGSNQEIARLAAAEYKKPVVFYNSKNEQTVTDGLNEKSVRERNLAPDARLTFLDQSHTTGSDVPQKLDAVGVVSIGRSMLLRDLLQAVWRLRGLEKGQEVRFLIDNEVEEILRQQLGLKAEQKITFREILRFVIENQCQQQGTDNFKAFKQEIWAIPQMLLISTLLNPDISVIDKKKAFTTLATLWIKPAQKSPRELYGNFAVERPSELVIREEANSCKTYLESIAKNVSFDLDSAFKEIDALAETTIKKVHPFVISPLSDDAATVEVEEETALQTELQVQTQVARDDLSVVLDSKRTYNYNLSYKDTVTKQDLDQYSLDYKYSMEHYFEKQPELARYAKLFDGITFSINVLEWQKGEQDPQNMQLLGNFRTPIHHLVVSGDDVCIFAQNDGNAVDAKDYYNLTLGFKDPKRKPSEKALEKIVKIKFLNGETVYSKKELAFLEKWIAENNPTELREFFQSIILNGQPNKATSFQASSLDRLFAKLLAVEE